MIIGGEPAALLRLLFIIGIVGGVVGLELLHPKSTTAPAER